jgi:DNA gyrase subunit A
LNTLLVAICHHPTNNCAASLLIAVLLLSKSRGVAYSKRAYQIPSAARTAKGVPVPQVLPISPQDRVTTVIPVRSFGTSDVTNSTEEAEANLVLLTERGYVKKTPLKAFQSISSRGLTIISLQKGDALRWARLCGPRDEVLIATRYSLCFAELSVLYTYLHLGFTECHA